MSALPDTRAPESDVVVLELPDVGYRIDKWLSYTATSSFLTPVDEFTFELAGASVPPGIRKALRSGARVRITVNDYVQAEGYVSTVTSAASRNAGWTISVTCHDNLVHAVAAGADPRLKFGQSDTLLDVVTKVFAPFGFTKFTVASEAVRNAKTGATKGAHIGKATKKHEPRPLKSYLIHELKPYNAEGAYQFAARVAERFGLWIHLSSQGDTLVLGKPEFDQDAIYSLVRRADTNNVATNIEEGSVTESNGEQPSCIVATGTSQGNDFDSAHMKVICVNEMVSLDGLGNPIPSVQASINACYDVGTTYLLPRRSAFASNAYRPNYYAVPVYLHDQDSRTPQQLSNFARREMALRQRQSLVCHYTVEGHTSREGSVWTVDTIVDVDDEVGGVKETMWVLSRTFEKSRHGTRTHLELIRPWTLFLGGETDDVEGTTTSVTVAPKGHTGSSDSIYWDTISGAPLKPPFRGTPDG